MRGLATFLVKALTIVGAGGGPLILQVYSSSKIAELPRKFQWNLNLNLNSQDSSGSAVEAKKQKESYWLEGLKKNKWQGVEQSKWGELSGKTARSAYKLAFRSSWIQEEDESLGDKSAKGALALIKASWGGFDGEKSKEVRIEEITVGEEKKVWLIIAKSESSIYLIPAVRASSEGRTGLGDSKADKKINEEGVVDIASWTREFDKEDKWEKEHNKCLEKEYSSGIKITRASSLVRNEEGKIKELKRKGWEIVYYEDGEEKEKGWAVYEREKTKGEKLSLNAGKIMGMRMNLGCRRGGKNKRYFPLDIKVLGDSTKLKDKENSSKNLNQEITIDDKISQVMGVRLDQVVISDTGIGAGKKNEIKWGSITKPTLVRELLK